jgi:hypothetical protein
MFCPKCGKQIGDDAKFCGFCGAEIKKASSEGDSVDAAANPSKPAASNAVSNLGSMKLGTIAGAVITFLACFAPFVVISFIISVSFSMCDYAFGIKVSGYQLSSFSIDGVLFMVLPIVVVVLMFVLKKGKASWITGIACGAVLVVDLLFMVGSLNGSGYSNYYSLGFGFYLMLIGSAVMLGCSIKGLLDERKAE